MSPTDRPECGWLYLSNSVLDNGDGNDNHEINKPLDVQLQMDCMDFNRSLPFPSLTTRVTHTHSTHPVGTSWIIIITRAGQSSLELPLFVPWNTATTIFHFLAYCYYPTCLCLCEYIIRLNCPVASGRRPCRPTVSQAGLGRPTDHLSSWLLSTVVVCCPVKLVVLRFVYHT